MKWVCSLYLEKEKELKGEMNGGGGHGGREFRDAGNNRG